MTSPSVSISESSAEDMATFTSAVVSATRRFDNTRPWWRGQRQADWILQPSIYRQGLASKEENLNARFRLMAKARRGGVQVPLTLLDGCF